MQANLATIETMEYGGRVMTNPYKIGLLEKAKMYAKGQPNARFALLRIWTHSHFYPLIVGPHNREMTSFEDAVNRSWEWKFIPKDMPGAEWSMQSNLDERLQPYRTMFVNGS